MRELESHLATLRVTINSAKKHHWMLKLVCESLLRNNIYGLEVSPYKMLNGKKYL